VVGVGYVGHGLTRLSESNSSVEPGLSFTGPTLHSTCCKRNPTTVWGYDSDNTSCCGETTCIKDCPTFLQYPVSRSVRLGGMVNTLSMSMPKRLRHLALFVITEEGFTNPSSKLPLGISELPEIVRSGYVWSAGIPECYYHHSSWRPWISVELGALRKRGFASMDIIRTLGHLHAGIA
jgi:hypothetical protein